MSVYTLMTASTLEVMDESTVIVENGLGTVSKVDSLQGSTMDRVIFLH